MTKKYYSVQNKATDSVDILIYGVIGESWYQESVTARQFVADLKSLEKDYKRINVRINSPGGSVFDGLPIFNALRNSSAEIHTYNDGLCASMAAVILLAGTTVHTADNALMMLHSPISGCYGNAGDMEQVLEMLGKVQDSLISCITSRNTSKTSEEIKAAYFDYKDHWLTADEASDEKFVDEIEKGSKKVSDKVKDMPHNEIMNQFDSLVKGRGLFDRFFSQAHDFFSPISEIDMDIKVLAKACGLSDKATEQEVLDWIEEHGKPVDETEETEETQEEEETEEEETTEETEELDPKDQEIATLKAQLAAKNKAPGAKDKKVVKSTDSKTTAVKDSFKTYSDAKATFDAVNDLFK
jgi:ATP-dependent Clp endopeptidase proteolytic subunit ClpP